MDQFFASNRKNIDEIREMMMINKRVVDRKVIEEKIVNGQKVQIVEAIEELKFNGREMTGVDYDIESLMQYLYLTCIDTIMGKIDYVDFVTWVKNKENGKDNFTISELEKLNEEYIEENGLRRNFMKAFSLLSIETKHRIINNFLIAKLNDGKIDELNKINYFAKYLYDNVRCKYTHSCFRSFLPTTPIELIQESKIEKIIAKKSPSEDTLNFLPRK